MDLSEHGSVEAHSTKVDMQDGVGIHSSTDEGDMSQIVNACELWSLGGGWHPQSSIRVVLISGWNEHLQPVYKFITKGELEYFTVKI